MFSWLNQTIFYVDKLRFDDQRGLKYRDNPQLGSGKEVDKS